MTVTTDTPRWLSTQQTADLLGVKPETVYAYVSRGVLQRHQGQDKRSSRFARAEVERLATRQRRGGRAGALEVLIDTELTLLDPSGGLYYRGQDATRLARTSSFEQVAELLWQTSDDAGVDEPWSAPDTMLRAGRRTQAALPKSAKPVDRMRVVVAALPSFDTRRDDRRTESAARATRWAIAAAVDCLPELSVPGGESIAYRLWSRLSATPPTARQLDALNAALVLLADHELAASTLAARVAASAWADPYLVLSTGLAAGGGTLHAAVSTAVETMLRSALDGHDAVGERLRAGERVPGFGHKVYTDRDPRADTLLELVRQAGRGPIDGVVAGVLEQTAAHGIPAPNVDLALGALVVKFGLTPGAGEAIFLLARMAGVIGHAMEEYPHRLRFRPRALYTGRPPAERS